MKPKLLLSALFSFFFYLLSSQIPQGFNYQAIARDGSGNPIVGATIKVKLSILSDTLGFRAGGGTYVWEEEHINVLTNAYGLFNIVLGDPGATKVQGVASFSVIDWNQPKLFIGTKIANPSTYKVLGGAKLWSVPYSLVAGELGGTVDKIKVKGTEVEPDSALFEVRNKDGQIVFAVYNEGVRVYVADGVKGNTKGGFAIGGFGTDKGTSQNYLTVSRDSIRAYVNDTISKGVTKGGFAIGGFGTAKSKPQDYLRVTRDSTRIYINDGNTKGNTKGGFAIGGFGTAKGGNANYLNVSTDTSGIIKPAQNRILWYPSKNAFLAGRILVENSNNVGENSFATGYESKAKGNYSQAMGFKAVSIGPNSTAIGNNTSAEGPNSFAMGESTRATGTSSTSMGSNTWAQGDLSTTMGYLTHTIGTGGTAIGYNTLASGNYSTAMGVNTIASAESSLALGSTNLASGANSTVMGWMSRSHGWMSTAIGYQDTALATGSIAIGYISRARGDFSVAIGAWSFASGLDAAAIGGYGAEANGDYSFATGLRSKANGVRSIAAGLESTASQDGAIALGTYAVANGRTAVSIGFQTQATANEAVALGYQTKALGGQSFAVGDGAQTSKWGSAAFGNNTRANAILSVAMGQGTISEAYSSMVIGRYNVPSGHPDGMDDSDPAFIIGGGYSDVSRRNAFMVRYNGNTDVTGNLIVTGNIGIGYSTPASAVHVQKNINGHLIYLKNSYNGATGHGIALFAGQDGVNSGAELITFFSPNQSYLGYIKQNGANSVQYLSASDIRLKENIVLTSYSIDDLMKVEVRDYNLISDMNKAKVTGFVAQELYEIYPFAVSKPTDEQGIWGVDYGKITPLIVKGVQDQQNMITQLREENLLLKNELQSLKEEVEQIKALLAKGGVR